VQVDRSQLAPVAAPVQPAPAASYAPTELAAGGKALLNDGAALRVRPIPEADRVDAAKADTLLTLKAHTTNSTGDWWYVTFDKGAGWAREADLHPAPAP
jgi:hypothetical protein